MAYPLPLELPPTDVVRLLGDMLQPDVPRLVLDAGAGTGRNGRFLAGLGHAVITLESNPVELTAEAPGSAILADVQHLPFGTAFDVAIMNEVTHLLPGKPSAHQALAELRRVTRQGGLNVVSGYLALPGRANARNTARFFHENELLELYVQQGWSVLSYEEEELPNQYIGQGAAQREIVSSRSKIIAQRPWMHISA